MIIDSFHYIVVQKFDLLLQIYELFVWISMPLDIRSLLLSLVIPDFLGFPKCCTDATLAPELSPVF
jgi:hypothetical protein